MRSLSRRLAVWFLATAIGCGCPAADPDKRPEVDRGGPTGPVGLKVSGVTQPSPNRSAVIAPVIAEPVSEVLVAVGDRVKAGQPLVRLKDAKARADLEARKTKLAEVQNLLGRLDPGEASAKADQLKAQVRIAAAELAKAQARLNQHTLTARIDGRVVSLDVRVGQVADPGTDVWGEIHDLRELDVRCLLSAEQVAILKVGQAADVSWEKAPKEQWGGKVISVSIAADADSGKVPVVVRVPNPEKRLPSGAEVLVRFLPRP